MIREDKSYLSSFDLLAIEKGIAQLDVYSLRFSREQLTEEEKDENQRIAKSVSSEEWFRICENKSARTAEKIEPLIEKLSDKFIIHQYKDSSMEHYDSNWDLFFWCNSNNKGRDYSYVTLSTNKKRTLEERLSDIKKVLEYIEEIGSEGIDIAIQYTVTYNSNIVKEIATDYFIKIQDKAVNFQGCNGKIKIVGKNHEGNLCYGFFKKGAKTKYYQVSNMDLMRMAITA